MDGVFMMKFLLHVMLWMLMGAVLFGSLTLENIEVACMSASVKMVSKLDSVASHLQDALGDCFSLESLIKPVKDQLTEKLDKLENFFGSRE